MSGVKALEAARPPFRHRPAGTSPPAESALSAIPPAARMKRRPAPLPAFSPTPFRELVSSRADVRVPLHGAVQLQRLPEPRASELHGLSKRKSAWSRRWGFGCTPRACCSWAAGREDRRAASDLDRRRRCGGRQRVHRPFPARACQRQQHRPGTVAPFTERTCTSRASAQSPS